MGVEPKTILSKKMRESNHTTSDPRERTQLTMPFRYAYVTITFFVFIFDPGVKFHRRMMYQRKLWFFVRHHQSLCFQHRNSQEETNDSLITERFLTC